MVPKRDSRPVTVGTGEASGALQRGELLELDRCDPLARFRDRFELPEGLIYLCGNSLGPVPRTMLARAEGLIAGEWGTDMVAAWNRHDWLELPERIGARIAPLLGVAEDEVIAADSVSLNLFKLLGALLLRARYRVVSQFESGETDSRGRGSDADGL